MLSLLGTEPESFTAKFTYIFLNVSMCKSVRCKIANVRVYVQAVRTFLNYAIMFFHMSGKVTLVLEMLLAIRISTTMSSQGSMADTVCLQIAFESKLLITVSAFKS